MDGLIGWSPGVTLEDIEKQVVLTAFRHYRGNKTATSNSLGIAVRTLDNKLEKYQVDAKAEKEKHTNERRNREEFLARCRGPAQIPDGARPVGGRDPVALQHQAQNGKGKESSPSTDAGVRMEPAPKPAAQQPMPMQERAKVQSVLPQQTSGGHSRGRR